MTAVALVGLGEVGRVIAEDSVAVIGGSVRAWDVAFVDPQSRAARNAADLGLDTDGLSAVAAVAQADLVFSAVTAANTLAAAESVAEALAVGTWSSTSTRRRRARSRRPRGWSRRPAAATSRPPSCHRSTRAAWRPRSCSAVPTQRPSRRSAPLSAGPVSRSTATRSGRPPPPSCAGRSWSRVWRRWSPSRCWPPAPGSRASPTA